ncbi:MAG: MarR family transcriptional regulator [Sphingobium sp.]
MTESIGSYLADTGRLMRKRFDAAARHHHVTGTQWGVLIRVNNDPGINQGQLAELLEVEPITTCRMVDRLVQAGLVERRRNPDDRRAWNIYVTDAALPLIETVREIGGAVVDQAVAGLTEDEQQTLASLLIRVRANLIDDKAFAPLEVQHG